MNVFRLIVTGSTWALLSGAALLWAGQVGEEESVLKDALAVWHLGGPGAADAKAVVRGMEGAEVGVPLEGAEKRASMIRGGDGQVAAFNGGCLLVESAALPGLNGIEALSLCLRLRGLQGASDGPLLSIRQPDGTFLPLLSRTKIDFSNVGFRERCRIQHDGALEFLWRNKREGLGPGQWSYTPDFGQGILRVSVPLDLIGSDAWHDVVVRITGPRLELYVDGVLVDEEWPYGSIQGFTDTLVIGAEPDKEGAAGRWSGQVDHLALWNRALTDSEVQRLCGGRAAAARREPEILGAPSLAAQYWRPRGYNAFVGDVMLFYHADRLHVFYLYDRRHHRSKWGVGAHQFGHMSSRDLVHWEHHPMALTITDQTECSLGTGSFVFRDGIYYLFYIQHAKRLTLAKAPYPGDNIFLATSRDGIHFSKQPKPVALMNYTGGDINPHLITPETGSRYLMTVSGWRVYASENLLDWVETACPQLQSIRWICTDDFKWNGFRYFTGCGNYVFSRQPIEQTSQWTQPANQALRDSLGVPVVSEFTGQRFIYAGFVGGRQNWDYAQQLVFRELVQDPDGTLGMKWPAEMIPRTGKALRGSLQPVKGHVELGDHTVRVGGAEGFSCAMLTNLPHNVRVTFKAKPRAGVLHFGVCCHAAGAYEKGCELRFEPGRGRMQFGEPRNGEADPALTSAVAMEEVPGLDREFNVDLIMKDDLVDVCVGERRTLIQRYGGVGDRLFLFARNGVVDFEALQVKPLLEQPPCSRR